MQQAGWEPLITVGQLIEAYPEQTLDLRSALSTYLTTTEYAEKNYNTLLRFTSVIFRIIDQLEKAPEDATAHFTDYVNSRTGSKLTTPVLAGEHDVSDVSIAETVYQDLSTYRDKAEKLIAEAPEGELKTKAEHQFKIFNYLDAYRYALATAE